MRRKELFARWGVYVITRHRHRNACSSNRKKSQFGADRFGPVGVVTKGEAVSIARGDQTHMVDLCSYVSRPLAFSFRYVRLRPMSHAIIFAAVLGAVACSVSTQYGVKYLVDVLSSHNSAGDPAHTACRITLRFKL